MNNGAGIPDAIRAVPTRSGPRARIMVATPTYTGDLVHKYVESYTSAAIYCLFHKVELELKIVSGASLIQYARNQLIREFLEDPTYTHLMWIDADVGFDPRAIMTLLNHDKDVVGGVYPMKSMPVEWPYDAMPGEQTSTLHRANILPGGFMLCSRKSMQAVADAADEYWHYTGGMRYLTKHVMDLTLENKKLLGEDVILCRKLQLAGFDIWVEPDIAFSHTGRFEWRGILAKAIEQGTPQGKIPPHLIQDLRNETDYERMGNICLDMFKAWGNTWAAPGVELLALANMARKHKMILETGSGLSTLVMAAANPNAEIHVLENDPDWCARLHQEIKGHGLTNVTIHLTPISQDNWFYVIPDDLPKSFDMVFHDGPQFLDGTGLEKNTDTRLPFYDVLSDRIEGAVLLLDDVEHYPEVLERYEHQLIGGRFAICQPRAKKAKAA